MLLGFPVRQRDASLQPIFHINEESPARFHHLLASRGSNRRFSVVQYTLPAS